MEINFVKLINGETLLAEVKDGGQYLSLMDPVVILQTPQGVALVEWLMGSEEKNVDIDWKYIMCSYLPTLEVLNMYKQTTGKGILTTL